MNKTNFVQVISMTKNVNTVNKLAWIVTEAMSDFAMACLYPRSPNWLFQIRTIGQDCVGKVHKI